MEDYSGDSLKSQMDKKGTAEVMPKGKAKLDAEIGNKAKDAGQYKDVDNQAKQAGAE